MLTLMGLSVKKRQFTVAKKLRKIGILGIKNHSSAAVRGGARRVRPPLDPLVHLYLTMLPFWQNISSFKQVDPD